MEKNPETTSKDGSSVFGFPSQQRALQIIIYGSIITTLVLSLIIFLLEGDAEARAPIIILFYIALILGFIYSIFKLGSHISKVEKDKMKTVAWNKYSEYVKTIKDSEGKLKVFLELKAKKASGNLPFVQGQNEHNEVRAIFDYAKTKLNFKKESEALHLILTEDLLSEDIGVDMIMRIAESIQTYSSILDRLTENLIAFMPENSEEIFHIEDAEMYRDIIFEENSWVEHEALKMEQTLDEWMKNHISKVNQNKLEMENILKEQKLALGSLLATTSNLKNSSFLKIRVQP